MNITIIHPVTGEQRKVDSDYLRELLRTGGADARNSVVFWTKHGKWKAAQASLELAELAEDLFDWLTGPLTPHPIAQARGEAE